MKWLLAVAAGLALVLTASAVLSFQLPHGDWDAWSMWNVKARFLAGGEWRHALQAERSHGDYPLLLPALVALTGSPRWVGLLFLAAVPVVLFAALRGARGMLALLTLAASSGYLLQGASQYADIPLSLFVLAAIAAALTGAGGWHVAAGVLASCAAWTKNEGIVFALAFCALGSVRVKLSALPGLAALAVFKFVYAPASEYGGQPWSRLFEPGRWAAILGQAVTEVWNWGLEPYLILAVVAWGFGLVRPAAVEWRWGAVAIAAQLASYLGAYLLTPADLKWQLGTSMNRLVAQVWPAMLLLFFAAVREPVFTRTPPEPRSTPPTPPSTSRSGRGKSRSR